MARCTAWATPYWLGLVVLLLPSRPSLAAAAAFSCSLSLTGTSSYPAKLTFSDVSLSCAPVSPTTAAETLSLQVHPDLFTLYHESFTGTGDMLLTGLTLTGVILISFRYLCRVCLSRRSRGNSGVNRLAIEHRLGGERYLRELPSRQRPGVVPQAYHTRAAINQRKL